MTMKETAVSSASPLYWPYVAAREIVRRRNLPDPLSRLAPGIVSASLAFEDLTAGLMQVLADRNLTGCNDLAWCRNHFFCFQKPEGDCIPG